MQLVGSQERVGIKTFSLSSPGVGKKLEFEFAALGHCLLIFCLSVSVACKYYIDTQTKDQCLMSYVSHLETGPLFLCGHLSHAKV